MEGTLVILQCRTMLYDVKSRGLAAICLNEFSTGVMLYNGCGSAARYRLENGFFAADVLERSSWILRHSLLQRCH
jgi:hypothetical protein